MGTNDIAHLVGFITDLANDERRRCEILSCLSKFVESDEHFLRMLVLIDRDAANWVVQSEGQGFVMVQHLLEQTEELFGNRALVDYIADNISVKSFWPCFLEKLILSGNLEAFSRLSRSIVSHGQQLISNIFYKIYPEFEKFVTFKQQKRFIPQLDAYTSGENSNLSLGNPIGTSKRKRVLFDAELGFHVQNVLIGSNCTVFLGECANVRQRNVFYVSGKFGDQHFLTPRPIETEEPVLCAAMGNAHLVLCSKGMIYVIGDNSKNQLGLGPSQKSTGQLRPQKLKDIFSDAGSRVIACATSNSHTVLQTNRELLVSGTSCGQMGYYAMRAFNQALGPPKSFTRLLYPDDSLNKSAHLKFIISDDITVLFLGNTGKVFFEYDEFKFVVDDRSSSIEAIQICKPITRLSSTRLIIWTSKAQIFLWTKSGGKNQHLNKPIWQLQNIFPQDESCWYSPESAHFSCSLDGDFYFVHRSVAHCGSLLLPRPSDSCSTIICEVQRLTDVPGYVQKVVISPTGRNVAFLVKKVVPQDAFLEQRVRRRAQVVALRHALFRRAQALPEEDLPVVEVRAKRRTFRVHLFMLRARSAKLLGMVENGALNLDYAEDDTLEELLEFIYTDQCHLIAAAKLISAPECEEGKWLCDVCGEVCSIEPAEPGEGGTPEPSVDRHFYAAAILRGEVETVLEAMGRSLKRLVQLAEILQCHHLKRIAQEHLEIMQTTEELAESPAAEQSDSPESATNGTAEAEYLSEETADRPQRAFIHPSVTVGQLFVEAEASVHLRCYDGLIPYSKSLLCSAVPYFEAFYRWKNDDDEVEGLELVGTGVETGELFAKFLIANSLDGFQLTTEQLLRLFVFSDRYGLDALMDAVIELLQENLHLDELPELCQLANTFYSPHLDQVLADFMFAHLPFVYDWNGLDVPTRVSQALRQHLWEQFRRTNRLKESAKEPISCACDTLQMFLQYANAVLESVLEGTDVNEFVRLIDSSKKRGKRRQRNSVSWSNSVGEEAIMQHRVEAEEAQLRLSESSNCEAISSQLDSQLVLSQVPSTSKAVEEKPRKKCAWRKVETNNNEETVQSHFDKQPDRGEVALNLSWASSPPDNDTDVVSLEQVMREEQDRAKSQQRARQRSWPVEVPRREKARDAGPAWGTACSPKTPPCSLRNIQEDEKHEIELANTTPRYKPMHVLETEERAIRELDEYYRRLYEDDDCVTIGVRREERTPPTERPEHTPLRWRQRKNTGVE